MARRTSGGGDLGEAMRRLARLDLRRTALGAFVIGVLLHACVAFAVLNDGSSSARPERPAPTAPARAPTPTPFPDRRSCEEIRGTDYRSEAERDWYRANCRGSFLAPEREDASPARAGLFSPLASVAAQRREQLEETSGLTS